MSYNIQNLDERLRNYVETNNLELVTKTYFDSESAKYFDIQTGVTHGLTVPIVNYDTTVVLQDGSACQFNAQGSETFTQRQLVGQAIAVNKEFCPKDLAASFAHAQTKANALGQGETLPFEAEIITANIKEINRKTGKLMWEGSKGSGDLIDGIITLANTDGNVVQVSKGEKNVYERCQDLYMAWDNTIGLKPIIWMSLNNFKALIKILVDSNMYHVFEKQDETYSIMLPGFDVEIKGLSDITGDTIIMTPKENLVYGVDGENDSEVVDLFWDKADRNFKFVVEYVIAVNYRISEYVYINK